MTRRAASMREVLQSAADFVVGVLWILWAVASLSIIVFVLSSATPFVHRIAPADFVEREPTWTIYEAAEALTGAPAAILEGIHFAETSKGRNYNHPDPFDKGDFGWHERPSYHEERARLFGEYDPLDPRKMAIRTGQLFQFNRARLGSDALAITAHNKGLGWAKAYGEYAPYVEKVLGILG